MSIGFRFLSKATWVALLVIAGSLVGLLWAFSPRAVAVVLVAGLGLPATWVILRSPYLTIGAFWLIYGLQSTMFSSVSSVEGLFYPLYALMLLNAALALISPAGRGKGANGRGVFFFLYGLFLSIVWVGLFRLGNLDDFFVRQHLFLYFLGLMTAIQLWRDPRRNRLLVFQGASSVLLAAWVIQTGMATNFAYRVSATAVNQNYLSSYIALGLLPMFIYVTSRETRMSSLLRALVWVGLAGGLYALVLLASRGITSSFLVAGTLAVGLQRRSFKSLLVIVLVATLVVIALFQLPGAQGLIDRLNGNDVTTLNGRASLWQDLSKVIRSGSGRELLWGRGVGASLVAIGDSAHSNYLQTIVDFGLFGLGAFISLHLFPIVGLWGRHDLSAVYAVSVLVFLLMSGLSSSEADYFHYWIVLGYTMALRLSAHALPLENPVSAQMLPRLARLGPQA